MNPTQTKQLTLDLMGQHNLLPHWSFKFDSTRTRFGQCRHHIQEIGISRYLSAMNQTPEVKDVILHEIAHALVGPNHGHDSEWQAKAVSIGASPNKYYDSETVKLANLYDFSCPKCAFKYRANRMPPKNRRYVCRHDLTPLILDNDPQEQAIKQFMLTHGCSREKAEQALTGDF